MTPLQDIKGGQCSQIEEAPAWDREIMLRLQAVELRTRGTADRDREYWTRENKRSEILDSLRTNQRNPRLPDPERFEGRRADFKAWTAQIWAKLSADMEGETGLRTFLVYSQPTRRERLEPHYSVGSCPS
jgi:hypothetical protein